MRKTQNVYTNVNTGGLPETNNPSCWPSMITNNNDNITNKAQNRTQKHKSTNKNTVLKRTK